MNDVTSVLMAGVGGQGSLLASKLLGNVSIAYGYDVKVSEVHGMSQRGGSVVTYVKFGDKVLSPLIERGEADYLVGFESCEAARWISNLKPDGISLINTQRISPMPVITGDAEYPENIAERFSSAGIKTFSFDALGMAVKAGSSKSVNVVMMGALSKLLVFEQAAWIDALKICIKPKLYDVNLAAFIMGADSVKL